MIDLYHFAALVKARLVAEGATEYAVLWGREHSQRKDNQGAGTANRVVVYDGPPDDATGTWVRRAASSNRHVRDQRGQLLEWERVTLDLWAYDGTRDALTGLDGGDEEGRQYRAKRALEQCVARACWDVLRTEGHLSTFLEETTDNRTTPNQRRHGDRCVLSFEIAFTNRRPAPTAAELVAPEPDTSSVVVTVAGNEYEEPTP